MLSQVVSAADINQSGAVNQVDLRKHDIVINNRPYKIKPGLSIDNRSELKRGSIVLLLKRSSNILLLKCGIRVIVILGQFKRLSDTPLITSNIYIGI